MAHFAAEEPVVKRRRLLGVGGPPDSDIDAADPPSDLDDDNIFLPDFARFLADEAKHGKHPNAMRRPRTLLAGNLVRALPDRPTQIFGLVLCRYHNTKEAFESFQPCLVRFAENRCLDTLKQELEQLYESLGRCFFFSGMGGRPKDARRGKPSGPLSFHVLRSLPAWWSAAQRAAALLGDPLTTPSTWHQDFFKIFPQLPLHGYQYWPKFCYGDIGMWVAPELDLLRHFTFTGVGPFKQLERWKYTIPPGGSHTREMTRQAVGLDAIRHIRYCINDFLAQGLYGLDRGNISPLTAYDIQVALCQYKKRA